MKLKRTYNIIRKKIRIELEACDFTDEENKAMDMLDEPIVDFQKTYPGGFTVSIANRKIRTQFKKVIINIDGIDDIEKANEAGVAFLDDIEEYMRLKMETLMDFYTQQIFPDKNAEVTICNYIVAGKKDPLPRPCHNPRYYYD